MRRCKRHGFRLGLPVPLEESMTTPRSILAWRITWAEEPGTLRSIGSQGVRHGWRDLAQHCTTVLYAELQTTQKHKHLWRMHADANLRQTPGLTHVIGHAHPRSHLFKVCNLSSYVGDLTVLFRSAVCLCVRICVLFGLERREDTAFKETREQCRRLRKSLAGGEHCFLKPHWKWMKNRKGVWSAFSRAQPLPCLCRLPTLAEGLSLSPFCRRPG